MTIEETMALLLKAQQRLEELRKHSGKKRMYSWKQGSYYSSVIYHNVDEMKVAMGGMKENQTIVTWIEE